MFGNVTAVDGLHVTGKYRDRSMQHTCSRHVAWDSHTKPASERDGNNLNGVKDFRTENGSSQRQNLALTGLCVPRSLHRGGWLGPAQSFLSTSMVNP